MAVLIVLTNWSELGDTGKKTGWYLPEVAHPYHVFKNSGLSITFASPNGGSTPMDPSGYEAFKEDPICKEFLEDQSISEQLNSTVSLSDVNSALYNVIFYVGGHGPMFDIPDCEASNTLVAKIYESGGIVSAVCHGTVGLLNVKLSNGSYLVSGHNITSFTNEEEYAVNLMDAMPFALQTKLEDHGANFHAAAVFTKNVQVSERIVTGQNPASATGTAEAVVKILNEM
ncbi:uncharacterized protein LOC100202657 [Hydra vulgaris]|uniref:uncharacterized protein LOC100202657 n=1 Tax=Hydra vulgaris TaxID=6087 RepID=UPI00019254C7|nr:glutathione-independent glyoxalase hsp3102-like [Hydra vulgaris]